MVYSVVVKGERESRISKQGTEESRVDRILCRAENN